MPIRKSTFSSGLSNNTSVYWFLLGWFILNLVQSVFTELAHDEAYYWMYSRNLAWGYFDHPPMVALLVKIGYSLFSNEFGVRLLFVLMGTSTIYIVYKLVDGYSINIRLFIAMCVSVAVFQTHIGGFFAIPDIPLVFFASLFLLGYRHYLKNMTWQAAVLLGIIASCMLYSKYHAVLVLAFTLLSNLKLLRKWNFWFIPIIIIIAMLPHLFWQINQHFPTFQYHLVSRSSAYTPLHTLNYIGVQLLMVGPFVALPLIFYGFKQRAESGFEQALRFNLFGFFGFFLLMSFRGHIEAHWTAVGFIPLFILAFKSISKKQKLIRTIQKLAIPSVITILILRIALMIPLFPASSPIGREFHRWDTWAHQIDSIANGYKVVFVNTFQRPAKYSFYTDGKFSHSLNNIYYRKNQYDIWPFEDSIQHQKVVLFGFYKAQYEINTVVGEKYYYQFFDDFISYNKLDVEVIAPRNVSDTMSVLPTTITIKNAQTYSFNLGADSLNPPFISAVLIKKDKFLKRQNVFTLPDTTLASNDSLVFKVDLPLLNKSGTFKYHIGIATSGLYQGFNSPPIEFVKNQ